MFADFPASTSTPEILVLVAFALVVLLLGALFLKHRLKAKIEELLHVMAVSRQFNFGLGGTAYDKYWGFRECDQVLLRALDNFNCGNYRHSEELFRQAEHYLGSVPPLLLESVYNTAKRTPLSRPVQYCESDYVLVRPLVQPQPEAILLIAVSAEWNVRGVVDRIRELLSRHSFHIVARLTAQDVVDRLTDGGERTAYERMVELRDALVQLDRELATEQGQIADGKGVVQIASVPFEHEVPFSTLYMQEVSRLFRLAMQPKWEAERLTK